MIWLWAAARASDPGDALQEARRAERERRWGDALALCSELVDAHPDAAEVGGCRAVIERWSLRRDPDGGFARQALLERVRRGEAPTSDLAAWAGDDTVPTVLRAEAAAFRARKALAGGDWAAAEAVLAPWAEARSGDPGVDAVLFGLSAELVAARGGARVPGTRSETLARAWWRSRADAAAMVGGAVGLGACVPTALRGLGQRVRPWGAVLLVAAAGVSWALAEGFEEGGGRPIPWMTAGLLAVHLVAVHALRGAETASGRWAIRGAVAAASLSVCWLAFDASSQ